MATIRVAVECPVVRSFRVDQVSGMFDMAVEQKAARCWEVELPGLDEAWEIGAIVGPSGSGKSTIARHWLGERLVSGHVWPEGKAVVDGFPEGMSIRDVTGVLNAVGFSSPPDWVKPYSALSNGQRFRCDLARALVSPGEVVGVDEFTSVVDRQVAQFGSAAVSKAVRRGQGVKRFVAVSCHYDILDWLEPDWVLDLAAGKLARGRLQCSGRRPAIELELRHAGREAWSVFGPHHYLSGQIHHSSRCYLAWWSGVPVAFVATLANGGHTGYRRIHRLVVLPDYQGLGIGVLTMEAVARLEHRTGRRMSITTSHPSLIRALQHRSGWKLASVQRNTDVRRNTGHHHKPDYGIRVDSGFHLRSMASFQYVGG